MLVHFDNLLNSEPIQRSVHLLEHVSIHFVVWSNSVLLWCPSILRTKVSNLGWVRPPCGLMYVFNPGWIRPLFGVMQVVWP